VKKDKIQKTKFEMRSKFESPNAKFKKRFFLATEHRIKRHAVQSQKGVDNREKALLRNPATPQ